MAPGFNADGVRRRAERSLAMHRAIAARLAADPDAVLGHARAHVRRMAEDPHTAWYSAEWAKWLDGPPSGLLDLLTAPGEYADSLRHVTPFAGVLAPQERWRLFSQGAGGRRAP